MRKQIVVLATSLSLLLPNTAVHADTQPLTTLTFDNLVENRKQIPKIAWTKFSTQFAQGKSKKIELKVLVGPHTKLYFKKPKNALSIVSTIFSEMAQPAEVILMQYSYQDLAWANKQLLTLVPKVELDRFVRNEGGSVLESNCNNATKNCIGAKALTDTTGISYVFMGIPTVLPVLKQDALSAQNGMTEAHEFFHTIQDVPMIQASLTKEVWPARWLIEGGAALVQNAAINVRSYNNYKNFERDYSLHLYGNFINFDPVYLNEWLDVSQLKKNPDKYETSEAYSLGSRVCEVLVAVKGPNSLIEIMNEMSEGMSFEAAFKSVYGVTWKIARPKIAEAIALNLKGHI